jgi:hypothetical protein
MQGTSVINMASAASMESLHMCPERGLTAQLERKDLSRV